MLLSILYQLVRCLLDLTAVTLRRELLDRIVVVNEHHLRRIRAVYLQHFNAARPTGCLRHSHWPGLKPRPQE